MAGLRFILAPGHDKAIPGPYRDITRDHHIAIIHIVLNGKPGQ